MGILTLEELPTPPGLGVGHSLHAWPAREFCICWQREGNASKCPRGLGALGLEYAHHKERDVARRSNQRDASQCSKVVRGLTVPEGWRQANTGEMGRTKSMRQRASQSHHRGTGPGGRLLSHWLEAEDGPNGPQKPVARNLNQVSQQEVEPRKESDSLLGQIYRVYWEPLCPVVTHHLPPSLGSTPLPVMSVNKELLSCQSTSGPCFAGSVLGT